MDLSDAFRKLLVDEINFATKTMSESKDASQILYYFSAVFGAIHRVFNIEYNPELIHTHFILRATFDAFSNRLKAIQQAGDQSVLISDKQFNKLIALSKELAKKINKKQDIDSTLKKFVILTYSTTGNGYYLMQKGLLKF